MEKYEILPKPNEFSERVLKLFNAWRKSVKATGNKKVLKKIDWLEKFRNYVRRQILNLERRGRLKEPIMSASRAQILIDGYKERCEYMYKRVGLYARPDQFTKTLLELFEDWRDFYKTTVPEEIPKEILENINYLECFCNFIATHLQSLKARGSLKGRLELRIKLTKAERLKKERALRIEMAKRDKFKNRLVEFFEDWKESVKTTGDEEVLDTTTGWLKKFDTYARRQLFSLEEDGRLKEPIIPDLMERMWKEKLKILYKEDRHYVKPDEFTERLLNLFEKVRRDQKKIFRGCTSTLAHTDWLGEFCSYMQQAIRGYL